MNEAARDDSAAKSVDHVYAAIKQAIGRMDYAPGEYIREQQLAQLLGVSRTPVREAFRRLGAEGWLEIKRNQGVRVTTWSIQDVEEIFEARALIEPYLVGRAVARITPEERARLKALALDMQATVRLPQDLTTLERWFDANRAFHQILTSACGNARLNQILNLMKEVPLIKWTFNNYKDRDRELSVLQHLEMVEAIEQGDAAWAEAVMRSHILRAQHTVLGKLRQQGGPGQP
jgi:DNA-binding GntR family transcriptional regulator